ncbi:MAG: ADP-ribosylglycohydrolase family protein [Acidobacteriota bacterium]|jgi:ADP-ribosylglycohydrolase|nr:ADP-ribosylglycohydrolase family protein [Acidobacteriota bacterium]
MIGAIAGDIIGSVYEHHSIKTKDFPLFNPSCRITDDTVLTVAVAQAILSGESYGDVIRRMGRRYPNVGYGRAFRGWLKSSQAEPYNSWGNGSAMRVSPVGFAFDSEEDVMVQAKASAEVTQKRRGDGAVQYDSRLIH